MQKIISLFQRNYDTDHLVRDEVVLGAEWVLAGEGIATRKWDGTCCMIKDEKNYKRYDAKHGKTPPAGFIPAQDPDPVTGHWPGWIYVDLMLPENKWHKEAFVKGFPPLSDGGTYELVGPRIGKNTDQFETHLLIPHGKAVITDAPRTFDELKVWFADKDMEGIVWHHPDGRMVKIKKKDFGYRR